MMPRAKQNARRHGVLSAPPAAEVEAHLRKILEIKTGEPLPDLTGARAAAALTLARREAELDRAPPLADGPLRAVGDTGAQGPLGALPPRGNGRRRRALEAYLALA